VEQEAARKVRKGTRDTTPPWNMYRARWRRVRTGARTRRRDIIIRTNTDVRQGTEKNNVT
jgi:hypothetical protein